jgi:flavin reductase (DIM6/NTAB) family NADH-FMN oxidoreductase RutF
MGSTNIHCLPSRPFPPALARADEAMIRIAARQVASGVSVITVGSGEASAGLTALSVSLLSADPATLVLCLNRASAGYAAFTRSSRFAVNVLGGDQREIAEHFASPGVEGGSGSFGIGRWLQLAADLSCFADCAAVFECDIEEILERHANAIVIGRVRRALMGGGSGALVRWRGVYDQLGWTQSEILRAVGLRPYGDTQESS